MLGRAMARQGAVAVRLSAEEIENIRRHAARHVAALDARRAQVPPGQPRSWAEISQAVPRKDGAELYASVRSVLKRHGIFDAAEHYVGQPLKMRAIEVQINDPADAHWREHFADAGVPDPATAYMHIDSVRRVKCMIYVTDVTDRNGPFRYVLGTNTIKIGRFEDMVRKANDLSRLDRCDRHTRELFWALPRALQKKSEFGNDLDDSAPETAALLASEHSFTSADGHLILFDNNGIHRGGMVLDGKRIVLQVPLG
jgi:hypothetical protein